MVDEQEVESLEAVMEAGREQIEEKQEVEDPGIPEALPMNEEIMADDHKFKQWLKSKVANEKIEQHWATLLKKMRDNSQKIQEKIENGEYPSDYFTLHMDPPFAPDDDPNNGSFDCPHGACENHNGRRTGWIRKKRTTNSGKEVVTEERCKCHPGYKKYGPTG